MADLENVRWCRVRWLANSLALGNAAECESNGRRRRAIAGADMKVVCERKKRGQIDVDCYMISAVIIIDFIVVERHCS